MTINNMLNTDYNTMRCGAQEIMKYFKTENLTSGTSEIQTKTNYGEIWRQYQVKVQNTYEICYFRYQINNLSANMEVVFLKS